MNVFELLLNAARLVGVRVVVVPGADGRGQGTLRRFEVVVMHHTADGPLGDYPSKDIVTFGRAGLRGLLSQLGLGRSGTIYIMGSGIAWHAGPSDWAGFWDLNDESIGIEAESVGTRDDWTPEQRDVYPRLVAALLYFGRRGADRAAFHREVANPPGRKIDPSFWYNPQTRNLIAWYLEDPLNRIPRFANPGPPPAPVVTLEDAVTVIDLPQTPYPPHKDDPAKPALWPDQTDLPSEEWPQVEKVIHCGFPLGWHGNLIARVVVGPGGGHLARAHFDRPGPHVHGWIDWPGMYMEPPNAQRNDIYFDFKARRLPGAPYALMITYASPWGDGSLNLEYEL